MVWVLGAAHLKSTNQNDATSFRLDPILCAKNLCKEGASLLKIEFLLYTACLVQFLEEASFEISILFFSLERDQLLSQFSYPFLNNAHSQRGEVKLRVKLSRCTTRETECRRNVAVYCAIYYPGVVVVCCFVEPISRVSVVTKVK